jgi:hypothetical protein
MLMCFQTASIHVAAEFVVGRVQPAHKVRLTSTPRTQVMLVDRIGHPIFCTITLESVDNMYPFIDLSQTGFQSAHR